MTATVEITALDALKAEVLESMDQWYYLVEAGRGDTLPEDVVEALVNGMEVWETDGGDLLMNWESEQRYDAVVYEIDRLVDDVLKGWGNHGATDEDLAALKSDWEFSPQWERVRDEMEERDRSEWFQHLVSNHGPVLLRVPIEGLGEGEWAPRGTDDDEDEYLDMTELCELLGSPYSWHLVSKVRDVVADVPSGVYMGYWLFAADLEDLIDAMQDEFLVVQGAHLLMGNPFTGSYAESERGAFTAKVKVSDLSTDEGAFGYSWQESTGGVTVSAYTVDSIKGVKA